MFSLICVWINDLVNNREAGDLRCYRAHYDVTVMMWETSGNDVGRFTHMHTQVPSNDAKALSKNLGSRWEHHGMLYQTSLAPLRYPLFFMGQIRTNFNTIQSFPAFLKEYSLRWIIGQYIWLLFFLGFFNIIIPCAYALNISRRADTLYSFLALEIYHLITVTTLSIISLANIFIGVYLSQQGFPGG